MGLSTFGVALIGALALGVGSAAAATITNPDWLVRPNAEDMASAYPELAVALVLDGRALVSCSVDTAGRARNCVVMSETPKGLGFGQAALELTDIFRFSPKKLDGRPIPGGSVQIPIRFVIPEATPPRIPPPLPPPPEASERTTRRLVDFLAQDLIDTYAARTDAAIERAGKAVAPTAADVVRKSLMTASKAQAHQWAQKGAAVYAALMTESELDSELEFVNSPAGQAMLARMRASTDGESDSFTYWRWLVAKHARPLFCATQVCEAAAWRAPDNLPSPEHALARQPDLETVFETAPPIPQMFGIAGWAQLNCFVEDNGALKTCIAAQESPEKLGLGVAALALADQYRLNREQAALDKDDMIALQVRFPVWPEPPETTPAGPYPITPMSIDLARRILAAGDFSGDLMKTRLDLEQAMVLWSADNAGVSSEAIAALRSVAGVADEATLNHFAERYASHFTVPQLGGILAYYGSPAAKARRRNRDQFNAHFEALNFDQGRAVGLAARQLFCAEWDCNLPASRPPKP